MDPVIEKYDQAWNASEVDQRRRLLEAALTDDCEMLEPRGRFVGREAILERITGFSDRFPGARVDITMAYVGTRNLFERAGFTKAADTDSVSGGFPRVLMRRSLA